MILSHKGHEESLQIEDMDDPAEPKRFFKLHRGKLCTLRLLLPFVSQDLKKDIYVKLCGTRGTCIPLVKRFDISHATAGMPTNPFSCVISASVCRASIAMGNLIAFTSASDT
jgi:hypothetical protein